jgi:hypothetical protein
LQKTYEKQLEDVRGERDRAIRRKGVWKAVGLAGPVVTLILGVLLGGAF